MYEDSQRLSTVDIVYDELKRNIIEFVYTPGEQLVESSLAIELGISRTPLRQALYRLELEGLVTKKINGRMHVSEVSIEEAKELFLVREVIEGLIAREATLNIFKSEDSQVKVDSLERIVTDMRRAAEKDYQEEIFKKGHQFHSLLETYSNIPTAGNILRQVNAQVARYRRIGVYRDPDYDYLRAVKEHEQILERLKEKNEIEVEVAMRNHIKNSLENTLAALSKEA